MTTVIITYIVGAILPVIALCMTSMITNYLSDEQDAIPDITDKEQVEETSEEPTEEHVEEPIQEEPIQEETVESQEETPVEQDKQPEKQSSHFINL